MNEDLAEYAEAAKLLRGLEDRDTGLGSSDEHIERVVTAFGQPIPSSYIEFLREFGWGGVADLEILGTGPDVPPFLNVIAILERERSEFEPSLARQLLPIQRDGLGNLFCLRARGSAVPCDVVFWDHEGDSRQDPELIAADFGTWLRAELGDLETG